MSMAEDFRANAKRERLAASREPLPNRRTMHERAASQWDDMAQALEDHELLTTKNAAAKAERAKSDA
jgi:hypothetical protein